MMKKYIELQTERLTLRQLQKSDWEMIFYLRSDEEVNKFVKRPSAETKEKAIEFIEMINDSIKTAEMYYWVITEKESDVMIGSISLHSFNDIRTVGEVGYDLHPFHRGRGIMDESLKTILKFGFDQLDLNTISAYTQWNNPKSIQLLLNNGFALDPNTVDEGNDDNRIYKRNS